MQQSECSEPSVDFFICLKVGPFLNFWHEDRFGLRGTNAPGYYSMFLLRTHLICENPMPRSKVMPKTNLGDFPK